MDKSDFYFSDGTPFYGIFKEIPMSGVWIKNEDKLPVYTTNEEDGELPSAHKVYMSAMNEYDAALKLVPTWSYWSNMLKQSVKIRRLIETWREEKMLQDQARAKALIWKQAEKGNIQAQKLLYESKKEEAAIRRAEREQHEKHTKEKDTLEGAYERILKSVS